MVHRNTYINGPTVLRETWQTKRRDDLFFAGQISGVEGYVESAASGLHRRPQRRGAGRAARSRGRRRARRPSARWPTTCRTPIRDTISRPTSRSASCRRSSRMPDGRTVKKADRKLATSERALGDLDEWMQRPVARDARPLCRLAGQHAGPQMKEQLATFLDYLRLNRNVSAHTVARLRQRPRAVPRVRRRAGRQESRRPASRRDLDLSDDSRASSASCTGRADARLGGAQALRACARSAAICGAKDGSKPIRRRWPCRRSASRRCRRICRSTRCRGCSRCPMRPTPLGRRDRAILELFYASGLA